MKMPLKMDNLSVTLNLTGWTGDVLRDVSLRVEPGETVCLVGESGSGKTITALALMRILPRVARWRVESLEIDGIATGGLSRRAFARVCGNRVAMVFQNPMSSLNPVLSIGEQMVEGYLAHGKGSRACGIAKAIDLLERVGVPAPADRMAQYPHQLSGGLRQRVAIAMALMCDPVLLIGDEPTTALDVTMQAQILRLLKDLVGELGIGLLLITHDLGVVARIADRVAVMYSGRVVEEGRAVDVFGAPMHPYTKGLIDCTPGTAPADRFRAIPGEVPSIDAYSTGCDFAGRCPSRRSACDAALPMQVDGDRSWRCVMPAPEARRACSPASEAVS